MFHLTKYSNLGPNAFVATLSTDSGFEVGYVWQRPGEQPRMRFATARIRDRFLNWVLVRTRPLSRSDEELLIVGAQMLRTWMHMDHASGICYRLAGDPDPWDSGTIRRLPTGLTPHLAKLHLAGRFPEQIPQIWDPTRHRFVPVCIPDQEQMPSQMAPSA